MTLVPIRLRPGVNSVETPTLNEGGFASAKNIRFFQGIAQKDGGFIELTNVPGAGVPRALRAWTSLSGASYLAIAGSLGLYVYRSGMTYNLSPSPTTVQIALAIDSTIGSNLFTIHDTVNLPAPGTTLQVKDPVAIGGALLGGGPANVYGIQSVNPGVSYTIVGPADAMATVMAGGICRVVTTTAGSSSVNVALANHGLAFGQTASFNNPFTAGGVLISGNYAVLSVPDPDHYIITASPQVASASAAVTENNGNIAITFLGTASGWGDYNVPTAELDNWGEWLIGNPWAGPIFEWEPALGTNFPAQIIPEAPAANDVMFVASQQQMIVVFGATDRITNMFDPMLVRWCSVGDLHDWTPMTTNQAGSFRLTIGSAARAGLALPSQNLLWTDLALYSMQYIQFPLVWGFQPLGVNCGADGPHAVGILAGVVYWKNRNQFMVLSPNGPETLPCPVWDDVFPNQDVSNLTDVVCETNSFFGEIAWSVPQNDGTFIFARLKVGSGEPPQWTVSTYHHHTAWIDQSVFGAPIGGHEDGVIDQHDVGVDAFDGPLPTSLMTGRIKIAEGDQITQIRGVIPDIKWLKPGSLSVRGFFYDNPDKAPRLTRPYTITPETKFIGLRGRGRDVAFELQGNDIGSMWRLGMFRVYAQGDGKR